ncbi:hypothetical protein [Hyphococcus sp.]|uniref:hypothetical protein n=1 Tax=Hyphococcus sp. TaxID=2038636 RepID=UPI0026A8BB03
MDLNIVTDYLAGLSLVEWMIFGFIGANALITGVCIVERSLLRTEEARFKD